MIIERPAASLLDAWNDGQAPGHEAPCLGLQVAGSAALDWRMKPRLNPYLLPNKPKAGWTHLLPWGQVFYRTKEDSPTPVFIRNMQAWCLGDAGWVQTHAGKVYGQQFGSLRLAGVTITQPPAPDDQTFGAVWPLGLVFHFWSQAGRKPYPAGMRGMLVTCEARADGDACIMLAADWYKDATTPVPSPNDFSVNCDLGIGRARVIGSEWSTFYWTSASMDDLRLL